MKGVSLFTGAGGFDVGFERAGGETALQVEIDQFCLEVLRARWPEVPKLEDIKRVTAEEIAGAADPGSCVWFGGFPCQDLSVAGRRAGLAGERSGLLWEFLRLAEQVRPRWIVIENVPGWTSSCACPACAERRGGGGGVLPRHLGTDFLVAVSALQWLGYGVAWRVLDARRFGVPQQRRRVFVVASLGTAGSAAVLLEPEGGGGDPAARGQAREGHPGRAAGGPGVAGGGGDSRAVTAKWAKRAGGPAGDEAGNLITPDEAGYVGPRAAHLGDNAHGAYVGGDQPPIGFAMRGGEGSSEEDGTPTMAANSVREGTNQSDGSPLAVAVPNEAGAIGAPGEGGHRLDLETGGAYVVEEPPADVVAFQSCRGDCAGNGAGVRDGEAEGMFTLTSADQHMVGFGHGEDAKTVTTNEGRHWDPTNETLVAGRAATFQPAHFNRGKSGVPLDEEARTVTSMTKHGDNAQCMAVAPEPTSFRPSHFNREKSGGGPLEGEVRTLTSGTRAGDTHPHVSFNPHDADPTFREDVSQSMRSGSHGAPGAVAFGSRDSSPRSTGEEAATLRAGGHHRSHMGGGQGQAVMIFEEEAIGFEPRRGDAAGDASTALIGADDSSERASVMVPASAVNRRNCSMGEGEAPCLIATDDAMVAHGVNENQAADVRIADHAAPLTHGGGKPGQSYPCVMIEGGAEGFDFRHLRGAGGESPTIPAERSYAHVHGEAVAFAERTREGGRNLETSPGASYCLGDPGGGGTAHARRLMTPQALVRRLTPLECERLQGWPDGWTCMCGGITSEACTCPDTPRYKAIGNGVASPVAEWLFRRLFAVDAAMRAAEPKP